METDNKSITAFSVHCLSKVCAYFRILFKTDISSEMSFDYSTINQPQDWALQMTRQLNGNVYINPISGKEFMEKDYFTRHGIELRFIKKQDISYDQRRCPFEPDLSIIDVMMFNSVKEGKCHPLILVNDHKEPSIYTSLRGSINFLLD